MCHVAHCVQVIPLQKTTVTCPQTHWSGEQTERLLQRRWGGWGGHFSLGEIGSECCAWGRVGGVILNNHGE